jgi:hypothetical protein
MALSYDDMMFECVLDNTETIKLSKKTLTNKKLTKSISSIKLSKKKLVKDSEPITYFKYNTKKVNFNDLRDLYSNYDYMKKDYEIIELEDEYIHAGYLPIL